MKQLFYLVLIATAFASCKKERLSPGNGVYTAPTDSLQPFYYLFDGVPQENFITSAVSYTAYSMTENGPPDSAFLIIQYYTDSSQCSVGFRVDKPKGVQLTGNDPDCWVTLSVNNQNYIVLSSKIKMTYKSSDSVAGLFSAQLMHPENGTIHSVTSGEFAQKYVQ